VVTPGFGLGDRYLRCMSSGTERLRNGESLQPFRRFVRRWALPPRVVPMTAMIGTHPTADSIGAAGFPDIFGPSPSEPVVSQLHSTELEQAKPHPTFIGAAGLIRRLGRCDLPVQSVHHQR